MNAIFLTVNEIETGKVGEIAVKKIPRIGEQLAIIARPDLQGWSGKTFEVTNVIHSIIYPAISEIKIQIKEIKTSK